MSKRFTVHIRWFDYDKTEGDIELKDNGQPILLSYCILDVQRLKCILNEMHEFKEKTFELIDARIEREEAIATSIEEFANTENSTSIAINRLIIGALNELKDKLLAYYKETEKMNFNLDLGCTEEELFTIEQRIQNRKKRLEIIREMHRRTETELEEEILDLERELKEDD